MPSKTEAQARLMAAAAHTSGGYGGVPQSVGRDFNRADTGGKLLRQAMMAKSIRKHGPGEDMRQHQPTAPKHQPKTVD